MSIDLLNWSQELKEAVAEAKSAIAAILAHARLVENGIITKSYKPTPLEVLEQLRTSRQGCIDAYLALPREVADQVETIEAYTDHLTVIEIQIWLLETALYGTSVFSANYARKSRNLSDVDEARKMPFSGGCDIEAYIKAYVAATENVTDSSGTSAISAA